jgi:hypothetical protein
MLRSSAICICSILFINCTQAWAGAWVQGKKAYYLKFSPSYFSTATEFNYRGKRLDLLEEHPAFTDASLRDVSLTTYLEYGLSDRFTLVANLLYKTLRDTRTVLIGGGILRFEEVRNTRGFADLTLSLRYALLKTPLVLSLQGGAKVPLGYEKTPANDGAPLGTAEVDGEIYLLSAKSLYPLPLYLTTGLGYRRRRGRLHDEILYSAEVGYSAGRLLVKLGIDAVQNTATPPDIYGQTVVSPLPGGGGVLPDIVIGDQHVVKLSPSAIYTLKPHLALQVDIFHALNGKNALSGTSGALGLVFSRP